LAEKVREKDKRGGRAAN